jgi:hypothetical protein
MHAQGPSLESNLPADLYETWRICDPSQTNFIYLPSDAAFIEGAWFPPLGS